MDDINDRLLPAYQQLHKSFSILKQCNVSFKEVLEKCHGEIDSIRNLSEQYTCCEEADVSALLIHLPDVKIKLLCGISKEIDKKLVRLKNYVEKFQEIHERISKQYYYSLEATKQLPLDLVVVATETIPAVSQMVEWLKDIDFLLHNHYCSKKFLIDTFDVHKVESNDFVKKWTLGNKEAVRKMNDVLCYVQFLLDDASLSHLSKK